MLYFINFNMLDRSHVNDTMLDGSLDFMQHTICVSVFVMRVIPAVMINYINIHC